MVLSTLLMVVLSAAPVGGAPAPAMANPPQTWSSSASLWYNNSSVSTGRFNATYSVQLFYGSSSLITATNTSNTTTQMQGQRWINASLLVRICSPNCTSPMYAEMLQFTSSEWQSQFLNLTTAATVYENGTGAAALGITNASARGLAVLNATQTFTRGNQSYHSSLLGRGLSYYSVQFTSPLGLIPWNLSKGLSWNDSAAFSAMGGWNDSFSASASWNGTSYFRSGSFAGTVARNGTESAWGRDLGTRGNNSTTIRIGLRFHGPFDFDNGLFMTAIGSDLFQGATANWTTRAAPSYWDAGPALSGEYAEHAQAAPVAGGGSGSSSGTSSSGAAGGSSSSAGGGASTTPGSGAPSGTGAGSGATPITPMPVASPVGGRSTASVPARSAFGMASFELLGLVAGLAAIGGFVGVSALGRRKPPTRSA